MSVVDPCKLRVVRRSRGLSQEKVAAAVGVSRYAYNRWEAAGRRSPTPWNFNVLCNVLECAPEELLLEDEQPPASSAEKTGSTGGIGKAKRGARRVR